MLLFTVSLFKSQYNELFCICEIGSVFPKGLTRCFQQHFVVTVVTLSSAAVLSRFM